MILSLTKAKETHDNENQISVQESAWIATNCCATFWQFDIRFIIFTIIFVQQWLVFPLHFDRSCDRAKVSKSIRLLFLHYFRSLFLYFLFFVLEIKLGVKCYITEKKDSKCISVVLRLFRHEKMDDNREVVLSTLDREFIGNASHRNHYSLFIEAAHKNVLFGVQVTCLFIAYHQCPV